MGLKRVTDFANGLVRGEVGCCELRPYGYPYNLFSPDILDEPFNDLTAWSVIGTGGTAEINPAGSLHLIGNSGGLTKGITQDLGGGVLGTWGYSIQLDLNIITMPAPDGSFSFVVSDGVHDIELKYALGLWGIKNSSGTFTGGAFGGTGNHYLVVVNSNAHSVKLYRSPDGISSWTFMVEWTDIFQNATRDGYIEILAKGAGSGQTEIRMDYFKIAFRAYYPNYNSNGKGYVTTGSDGTGTPAVKQDTWEYDPTANTWTQKANYPLTRFGGVACPSNVDGALIFGTGMQSNFSVPKTFYRYCPTALNSFGQTANTWVAVDSLPATTPPYGRRDGVGTGTGGYGYLFSGYNDFGGGYLNDFYEYDFLAPATAQWVLRNSAQGARRYPQIIAMQFEKGTGFEGYIFQIGGINNAGNPTKSLWTMDSPDPLANFTQQADCLDNVYAGVAFIKDGRVYCGLGGQTIDSHQLWEYNPSANTWRLAETLSIRRGNPIYFSIGERRAFFGGGYDESSVCRTEMYEWLSGGILTPNKIW